MRRSLRQYWLAVHLYAGVLLGGVFVLLGITGSLLVFYLGVDESLNPETQVHQTVTKPLSAEAVLRKLRQYFPDRSGPWRIEMPLSDDSPVMARYYKPPERAGRFFSPLMVTLDPKTLDMTSHRFWGDYAVTWVYDLHYTLLFEENGRTAVGIIGLLMQVSLLSGLYLWWPSKRRLFAALRPQLRNGNARRVYDLHVMGGIYFWPVMLGLAVTGSALALPDQTRSLLGVDGHQHDPVHGAVPHAMNRKAMDLDVAVRVAQSRFPDAEVRWVESSGVEGKPISVRMFQHGEPGRRFPRTQAWIHPETGEILALNDPMQNKATNSILDWLHPLHNGEAFGMPGRIIVLCAGLVLPLLFVTGLIRWRQKIRARKKPARSLVPV